MGRYGSESSAFGFEDLEVYKAARAFRKRIYRLVELLPDKEKFSLASQMRRAAVSLTSNIAEGYGRHHWQENTQFCRHARGSLLELIDQINLCIDEGYAETEHLNALKQDDAVRFLKLINGYISYLQKQKVSAK